MTSKGAGAKAANLPGFPSFFIPINFNLSFDYSTPRVFSDWTYFGLSNHMHAHSSLHQREPSHAFQAGTTSPNQKA